MLYSPHCMYPTKPGCNAMLLAKCNIMRRAVSCSMLMLSNPLDLLEILGPGRPQEYSLRCWSCPWLSCRH